MQSEKPLNEMAPVASGKPVTNLDSRYNSDIRKTRTITLIILAIQLVFAIYYFVQRCIDLHRYYDIPVGTRDTKLAASYIGSLIAAGLILIYILVFIFVVVKYIRLGILILAWLAMIQLIFNVIIVILGIIGVIAISAANHSVGVGIVAGIIIIVVAVLSSILSILLIVFSFKLAKLLKIQEVYQLV